MEPQAQFVFGHLGSNGYTTRLPAGDYNKKWQVNAGLNGSF